MQPEEVPRRFAPETSTQAFVTWTLLATNVWDGEEGKIVAQYVTHYYGRRLAHDLELGDASASGSVLYAAFVDDLDGNVPPEHVAQMREVDPAVIESWYRTTVNHAKEKGIALSELAAALREIAAVIVFVSSQMADAERERGRGSQ